MYGDVALWMRPALQTSLPVFTQCILGAHYRCLRACETHHDAVVWTLFIKYYKTNNTEILKRLTKTTGVRFTLTVYARVRQTGLFCVIVSVSVCLLRYIHRDLFVLRVIFPFNVFLFFPSLHTHRIRYTLSALLSHIGAVIICSVRFVL